ncbi:MAG TPA: cofactor-independent phosphoglycerate mutase [Candidatus Omnitrophota bacterium]|nr:cofactor-independent phosphoglycerate mutase [Candidatus Omnitrophota bacterium]
MKYIVIVPDGMADHPVEALGNKTPLEAARTTNMDYLASRGMTGLVQTIPLGMYPGSDVGNMAILGYDPKEYHTGRAPIEAANQNLILEDDEVAFRCNLVTVENGKMVDYSAGHIPTKEASILIDALNKEVDLEAVKFYVGKSYRHLMILKARDPKAYLKAQTIPPHDILGREIKKFLPRGGEAEFLLSLMERAKVLLENHEVNKVRVDLKENPANMIWLWGQGSHPSLPSFKDKYGVEGSIISAVDLVCGIGRLAGLEIIDVPGITGYYDTNYLGKAQYALNSLEKKDFVYIHIEAPDEAGHNGDIRAKIEAIERVDKDIVGTILNYYNEHDDVRILILPDHPTPVELRTHTNEPVCFVMTGKGIAQDGSRQLSEAAAKEKGVKFDSGPAMMDYFMRTHN